MIEIGKILDLKKTKEFLRVEFEEEDVFIETLIEASEIYLKNATGKDFNSENNLAVLYCSILVNDWYSNRELVIQGSVSNKVRFSLQSILLQLKLM